MKDYQGAMEIFFGFIVVKQQYANGSSNRRKVSSPEIVFNKMYLQEF
jgi:hypothetical protein